MQGTVTAGDHAGDGCHVVRGAFSLPEVEPLLAGAAEHAEWSAG